MIPLGHHEKVENVFVAKQTMKNQLYASKSVSADGGGVDKKPHTCKAASDG